MLIQSEYQTGTYTLWRFAESKYLYTKCSKADLSWTADIYYFDINLLLEVCVVHARDIFVCFYVHAFSLCVGVGM